MDSVFWDRKRDLLVDFLEKGETINAAKYCETLKNLRTAMQNKCNGMLMTRITSVARVPS